MYLISGGFIQVIAPVADSIGIPRENVYANDLQFNDEGTTHAVHKEQRCLLLIVSLKVNMLDLMKSS